MHCNICHADYCDVTPAHDDNERETGALNPQYPTNRQDSLYDQLLTVYKLANEAGCYDAADAIKEVLINPTEKLLPPLKIEVKIKAPFKYFSDKYGWDNVCAVLGWDVYWAREGLGDSDEVISLTESQIAVLEGK